MKTTTIHELLNDIEKLNNYLHRWASRAATARTALGVPGVRILNRVLGYVKRVRDEIHQLEAIQNGSSHKRKEVTLNQLKINDFY